VLVSSKARSDITLSRDKRQGTNDLDCFPHCVAQSIVRTCGSFVQFPLVAVVVNYEKRKTSFDVISLQFAG
jgi:hypothetical protein